MHGQYLGTEALLVEIRNDLILDAAGVRAYLLERLAAVL